jgi:esterase/lipase
VKNTCFVIANEVLPLRRVSRILRTTVNLSSRKLREQTADALCARDQADFGENYNRYYEEGASKPPEVGRPFLLEGTRSTGIVLSHGYLAAPHEVRPLAEYLNGLGFTVYVVRLEGHGTAPAHLRDITWLNWLHSYYRGYAVMRNLCSDVILGGFSTGGLLSLVTTANMGDTVKGVFAINASLRLRDIRTRFVAPFMFWTDILQKFGREAEEDAYVEHLSENPHINYSRNYINGIRELQRLIGACEEALPSIQTPALIMQGRNDPAVNPRSAKLIFDAIASEQKELKWMEFDRHVIVQHERKAEVFSAIGDFAESIAAPVTV